MNIAVCLTSYNRADIVRETLESIAAQTVPLKLFVCRDGSTDHIDMVLDEFSHRFQIFVTPYRADTSVGCAKHRAVALALRDPSIDLIQMIDSDDKMLPTMLETNVAALEAEEADWVLSWGRTFGRNEGYIPSWICTMDELYQHNTMHSWVMAKVNVFQKHQFREKLNGMDDWDWWIRVMGDPSFKGAINKQQVYLYRVHSDRVTDTQKETFEQLREKVHALNPR